MHAPLSNRERRQLDKLERIMKRGFARTVALAAVIGAVGGLLFTGGMLAVAPCFGCRPLTPPDGTERFYGLEWMIYSLSNLLGASAAFAIVSALVFAAMTGALGMRQWSVMKRLHRSLAERAIGSSLPNDR